MISNIDLDIKAAYGSLEHPDWSFVIGRMKVGLYDDLINKLADFGSVQETTDQNDDCSRCLFVATGKDALTLRLSLIGKYACIHDEDGRFLSESDLYGNALGENLLRQLKANEVGVINEGVLRTQIEFGGEKRSLYEVLFSSDGLIS